MANKSKKSTLKSFMLRDEPILQPPRILTARNHSICGQFDKSNYWDTTMANRAQGCMDKGKTPVVVSRRANKRVYNGRTSNQQTPNMVSHHPLMNMPRVEHTSMSNQHYDILGEEAMIEKELMNGSYEFNSHLMARFWEESRSDDELTDENYERINQPNNIVREESRVEDEIMNGSHEQELQPGDGIADKLKKVRGPTYMDRVWGRPTHLERYPVKYNDYGQPISGKCSMLCHFLGSIARNGKYCPIDVKDWRAMSREKRTFMLDVIKLRFHVPKTAEKWIMSSIGEKWRNWKHFLKVNFWKDDTPLVNLIQQEKEKRIKLDQWIKLVTYWNSDEAKEVSKRNKKARAKKSMKQITGKRSFAQVEHKLEEELGRPPKRYELFGACFVKPNVESSDDASRKYLEMQERNSQLAEGSGDPIGPDDVFAQVMGPDRPGHVRMMGKGVCPSDVWGELPRRTSNRILMEQQAQITQLQTLLAQQRCGDSQLPSTQNGLSVNSLSNRAATNLPLMVGAHVCLKHLFDSKRIVAKGCIHSINPCSEVGGQLLGSNWCEVNVKVVLEPEEDLIRPYGSFQKLSQVLGEMIAWPCNLVTPSED